MIKENLQYLIFFLKAISEIILERCTMVLQIKKMVIRIVVVVTEANMKQAQISQIYIL